MNYLLLAASLFLSSGTPTIPLPGQTAPSMEAAEWIKGAPSAEQPEDHHFVVTLVNSYTPSTGEDLADLAKLEDEYEGKLTAIAAFIWEFDATAPRTFIDQEGQISPSQVIIDQVPEGQEANFGIIAQAWLGSSQHSSFPRTFLIDADWKLLWTGSHPSKVDSVIQGIADESLDYTDYAVRAVEAAVARQAYEAAVDPALAAIEAGEFERAMDMADAALKIKPEYGKSFGHQVFIFVAQLTEKKAPEDVEAMKLFERALDSAALYCGCGTDEKFRPKE